MEGSWRTADVGGGDLQKEEAATYRVEEAATCGRGREAEAVVAWMAEQGQPRMAELGRRPRPAGLPKGARAGAGGVARCEGRRGGALRGPVVRRVEGDGGAVRHGGRCIAGPVGCSAHAGAGRVGHPVGLRCDASPAGGVRWRCWEVGGGNDAGDAGGGDDAGGR